ncbi:MAG: hypothetical protein J6Y87_06080 [Muribaculaceae bacterium]|nr:hypothetical protein [Muribaculaceae bacterium]
MGAIIGILSRLFSKGGLIVLALLGLMLGVLGDVLKIVFFTYGAIAGVIIIVSILPGAIPTVAILFEHLIYPFRWLNNILLGAEKPEFDFLKVKCWYTKPLSIFRKKTMKKERLAEWASFFVFRGRCSALYLCRIFYGRLPFCVGREAV